MNILLIGCGNIGRMLLKSWVKSDSYQRVVVIQPSLGAAPEFPQENISFFSEAQQIPADFSPDAVLIALKPQQLAVALPEYQRFTAGSVFVSIATGAHVATLQQQIGGTSTVIRVMPNVAMQVAASTNLAFTPEDTHKNQRKIATALFEATGPVLWLNQEADLEILTPISGSGPAYFFLLAQLLVDEAVSHGIDKTKASEAVRQMLLGSALLAEKNPDLAALKQSVTSKGGCTEAALSILEPKFPELVKQAIDAAHKRQAELGA